VNYLILVLTLLISTSVLAKTKHKESVADMQTNAHALYMEESRDYVEALGEALIYLKALRNLKVSEEFRGRISQIENGLAKDNIETIRLVTSYLREKRGKVFLDDVLLLRMAKLYFDRVNYILHKSMQKYEKRLNKFYEGKIKAAPTMPAPDYTKSIRFCETLLKRFPNSPLNDSAEYLLSFIYEEQGKFEKAQEIFENFRAKYPFSKSF